jgi:hypothetical protein
VNTTTHLALQHNQLMSERGIPPQVGSFKTEWGAERWRLHHAELAMAAPSRRIKAAADRTGYSRICKRAHDLTNQTWRLADAILEIQPTTKPGVSVQAAALAKDDSFDFIETH